VALAAIVGTLVAAGCSSGGSSSSGSSASAAPSGTAVNTSQCGTKPGVKATGTPIPLGAIATNQPGTSFTDIPNMAAAYFDCVNANGGINGHPIKLYIRTEQTNPAQIAADAKQLVQTDHVGRDRRQHVDPRVHDQPQLLGEARLLRH
jgi:branched-chain amino acid transport system substrate-binding protein